MSGKSSSTTLANLFSLLAVPGVGEQTAAEITRAGLLDHLWDFSPFEINSRLKTMGERRSEEIASYLATHQEELIQTGERASRQIQKRGIRFLTLKSSLYPQALLDVSPPPAWLFVKGDPSLLKKTGVAIVGTRTPDTWGQQLAYRLSARLSQYDVAIVSGLAPGIDTAAHKGALAGYGLTIAVLGQGLRLGKENILGENILAAGGVVVSPYLPGTRPSRQRFLYRNSLIAALAIVMIPVQILNESSGTGAAVRRAQTMERPVIGFYDSKAIHSQANHLTAEVLRKMNVPMVDISPGWKSVIEALRQATSYSWELKNANQREAWFRSLRQHIEKEAPWFAISPKDWQDFCEVIQQHLICRQDEEWL